MNRQKTLLNREDIQIVLSSLEEQKKEPEQSPVKEPVAEFDSDEEADVLLSKEAMDGFRIDSDTEESKEENSPKEKPEIPSPEKEPDVSEEAPKQEEAKQEITPADIEALDEL